MTRKEFYLDCLYDSVCEYRTMEGFGQTTEDRVRIIGEMLCRLVDYLTEEDTDA